jgi:tripartite-type tricarboxylate transporter receptor subunit TctC
MLALINYVKAGQLRAIAVTSGKRVSSMPELPTVAESVPGYEAIAWYMVLVPGKTPAAIVNRLHAESARAIRSDDMAEMLARAGTEPLGNTPQEAAQFLKIEIARWGKVITSAHVKAD